MELDDIAIPAMTLREVMTQYLDEHSDFQERWLTSFGHDPSWKAAVDIKRTCVVRIADIMPLLAARRLTGV